MVYILLCSFLFLHTGDRVVPEIGQDGASMAVISYILQVSEYVGHQVGRFGWMLAMNHA